MLDVKLTMIRQEFESKKLDDVGASGTRLICTPDLKPASVAIAVGSRGISNLEEIVHSTVKWVVARLETVHHPSYGEP